MLYVILAFEDSFKFIINKDRCDVHRRFKV